MLAKPNRGRGEDTDQGRSICGVCVYIYVNMHTCAHTHVCIYMCTPYGLRAVGPDYKGLEDSERRSQD